MKKQTFIIECWFGRDTCKQAFLDQSAEGVDYNFYRVGCKKLETAKKYLKGWREQAIAGGLFFPQTSCRLQCSILYQGYTLRKRR